MPDLLQIQSYETSNQALEATSDALVSELQMSQGQETLLLLAGGSATKVYAKAVTEIKTWPTGILSQLSIAVEDERWPIKNNTQEIRESGFIDVCQEKGADFYELSGTTQEEVARNFQEWLKAHWQRPGIKTVAVIGIGADGHILSVNANPEDPDRFTTLFESKTLVAAYHSEATTAAFPNFPDRVTVTLSGLRYVNKVLGFVAGSDKLETLKMLRYSDLPYYQQPAQALKQLSTTIFTDQVV